jgi:hypothetical protein
MGVRQTGGGAGERRPRGDGRLAAAARCTSLGSGQAGNGRPWEFRRASGKRWRGSCRCERGRGSLLSCGGGSGAGGALLWGGQSTAASGRPNRRASVAKRTRQGRLKAQPAGPGCMRTRRAARASHGAWRRVEGGRCLGVAYGRLLGWRPHDVMQSTAGASRCPYTGDIRG